MIRTLLTVLFLSLLSTPVFADWTKVDVSLSGNTHYVDFERIRKHGGYVYFWDLQDNLKPTDYGDLSAKTHKQGDCKLFRYKFLSGVFYEEPMGRGVGHSPPVPEEFKDWKYPPPNSSGESILKSVCEYAK